jgi:hypothetical protein
MMFPAHLTSVDELKRPEALMWRELILQAETRSAMGALRDEAAQRLQQAKEGWWQASWSDAAADVQSDAAQQYVEWEMLCRFIDREWRQRFEPTPTYAITDYETPGELRHRVGTF